MSQPPPGLPRALRGAALAALALVLGAACAPAPPPNLVLVTVDTLRADRLACYGGPADVGTALCGLAEHGTRFAWAFSAAPFTLPSVASILTSRYPAHHAVDQSAASLLRRDAVTVARALADAGYDTGAVVSSAVLGRDAFGGGFARFDHALDAAETNRRSYRERIAAKTTDAALAWVGGARPPWFLWVHFQDPHGPYDPPDAPRRADDPAQPPLPLLGRDAGAGGIPRYQELPGLRTAGAYEARYLDEIRYLDRHLARLVEGLDAAGAPPGILLTADHGEAFGDDGYYFLHGVSVGLDQIRVPLLWRPTQPGTARVVEQAVSLVDVAPTLLALAGLEVPDAFQGRPLPLDGVEAVAGDRTIYSEGLLSVAAIRGRDYYARPRVAPEDVPPADAAAGRFGPRGARLEGSGALPRYRTETDPRLEPDLARFLEATRGVPEGARRRVVPDETRKAMRALGYLDEGE